jgi:hypothetical protein
MNFCNLQASSNTGWIPVKMKYKPGDPSSRWRGIRDDSRVRGQGGRSGDPDLKLNYK